MNSADQAPSSKRKRSSNWKEEETLFMIEMVGVHYGSIKGKFSSNLTLKDKKASWTEVTARLNSAFNLCRTQVEVEKKWQNVKTTALKNSATVRRELNKTG